MYKPQHLTKWTYPEAYAGRVFPDWYYAPCTQNRDSDCLDKSNYAAQAKALAPFADNVYFDEEEGEECSTVQDHRFGHWACGWYEAVLIHESDEAALMMADSLAASLADYPVLDEEDLSEREEEEAAWAWTHSSVRERADLIRRYSPGTSLFAARRNEVPDDPQGGIRDRLLGH